MRNIHIALMVMPVVAAATNCVLLKLHIIVMEHKHTLYTSIAK